MNHVVWVQNMGSKTKSIKKKKKLAVASCEKKNINIHSYAENQAENQASNPWTLIVFN